MSSIDYAKIHTISVETIDMPYLYTIIDPSTFMRLYIKKELKSSNDASNGKSSDKGKKDDRKNIYDEHKELLTKFNTEENRAKTIISLAMVFKAFRTAKYEKGICTATLNTMMAFELYVSVSTRINTLRLHISTLNKRMEKEDILTSEMSNLQMDINECVKEVEVLCAINRSLVESLTPELLYELTNEYKTFCSAEHARRCLI